MAAINGDECVVNGEENGHDICVKRERRESVEDVSSTNGTAAILQAQAQAQEEDGEGDGEEEASSPTPTTSNGEVTKKRRLPTWMVSGEVAEGDTNTEDSTEAESTNKRCRVADLAAAAQPTATSASTTAATATPTATPTATATASSSTIAMATTQTLPSQVQIKQEPTEDDAHEDTASLQPSCSGVSNPVDVKPNVKVEKADASSTTSRESCRFGIRCYRRNPMHRIEEAHPGDKDYKRPNYPTPPLGTPNCPYGNQCYRRNPDHFQQYYHPPETDFEKNYRMRLRQRKRQQQQNSTNNGNGNDTAAASGNSSDDDGDLDDWDPFSDDEDAEYVPGADEDDEETEEFMADYDDCDKAEE